MDLSTFWSIIDEARDTSTIVDESLKERLVQTLLPLGVDDLAAFQAHFAATKKRAYDWDVWNAIYLIRGGCSDDSFSDFRDCLVMKGRDVFERIVNDPESLLDGLDDEGKWPFIETYFVNAATEAYRLQQGRPRNDFDCELPYDHPLLGEPSGEDADPDDEEVVRSRYPRIWEHLQNRRDPK